MQTEEEGGIYGENGWRRGCQHGGGFCPVKEKGFHEVYVLAVLNAGDNISTCMISSFCFYIHSTIYFPNLKQNGLGNRQNK